MPTAVDLAAENSRLKAENEVLRSQRDTATQIARLLHRDGWRHAYRDSKTGELTVPYPHQENL